MSFKVKKITNNISKILMSMVIVSGVTLMNSSSVYAEELTNDKSFASENYVLTIEERGGIEEQIDGDSINVQHNGQNNNLYDETLLKQSIDKLSCLDESKVIESQNPKIEYLNGVYVLRKEIYGTRINKDVLYSSISNAVKNNVTKINLDSINAYIDPTYLSNSQVVLDALNAANRYLSANITYNYGGKTKQLDYSTIKNWISIDENYNVLLNENGAANFVSEIANDYSNSLGISIPVSGGYSGNNHGWAVDSNTEAATLVSLIKSGQVTSKSPAYYETGKLKYLKNVGDTFVEADLTAQHLWFYKNGYIVAEGDLVSGNISAGNATPAGSYSLNSKQTNTDLIGPNYVSRVAYWMPFIGNSIGLHDASWRSEFGGQIYKTNGSHGCVNLPYSVAEKIYSNISVGTPVICYY